MQRLCLPIITCSYLAAAAALAARSRPQALPVAHGQCHAQQGQRQCPLPAAAPVYDDGMTGGGRQDVRYLVRSLYRLKQPLTRPHYPMHVGLCSVPLP